MYNIVFLSIFYPRQFLFEIFDKERKVRITLLTELFKTNPTMFK